MHKAFIIYLVSINAISFIIYGIDKWKATRNRWRIPEARLLWIAVLGGALGAWSGMYLFHHKTRHTKFKYGVPAILLLQLLTIIYLIKL